MYISYTEVERFSASCTRNETLTSLPKRCEPTCHKPKTHCENAKPKAVRVCQCKDGFVRWRKTCVARSDCPASHKKNTGRKQPHKHRKNLEGKGKKAHNHRHNHRNGEQKGGGKAQKDE